MNSLTFAVFLCSQILNHSTLLYCSIPLTCYKKIWNFYFCLKNELHVVASGIVNGPQM